MRKHLFTLLLLSLSPTALAGDATPGVFLQTDLGRAERGAGVRAGFGLGYRFASGWAVSASTQRLYQGYASAAFVGGPDSEPTLLLELHPEVRSRALLLSKEWTLTEDGDWRVRGSLGAHHWTFDARSDGDGFLALDAHLSGTDPVAKIELSRRIADRLSIGLGVERYWFGSADLDRVAVSLRYQMGGSD